MKLLRFPALAALLLSILSTFNGFSQDSLFFNQPLDSVVMIEFDWSVKSRIRTIIDSEGKLTVTPTKKVVITPKEQHMLVKALNDKQSFGGGQAGCYEPRLGFLFYRNGAVSGHLTICVTCDYLVSSQKIPAQQQNPMTDEETGEIYYLGMGMSKRLLGKLDKLLEQYQFRYRV